MDALGQIRFDVVGLSETHTKKAQRMRWTDGKLRGAEIHVGPCTISQNDSTIGGIGFIIHKSLTSSILSIELKSSRIGIIQVYAPHSGYSEDAHEDFYAELDLKLAEPACRTIVMGNFNARTGRGQPGEGFIGQFSAEQRNSAGHRMTAFTESKKMYVMNTFFEKPRRKRWTWQSADGTTRSEIDYVLCDDRSCVQNFEVLARFMARSDHKIVRATLLLDLPGMKRKRALLGKKKVPAEIDPAKLRAEVRSANWNDSGDSRLNERYEQLEKTLMRCVKTAEVKRRKANESKIKPETRALLAKLQSLKQSGGRPDECRELSREIRKKLKADYEEHRNKRLVEAAVARQSVKKCKRGLAQSQLVTGALLDENGALQTERPAVEDVCRAFYTSLFDSKVEVARTEGSPEEHPATPAPISWLEIQDALKTFKNGKAPGPDGVTAEMLKAGGPELWKRISKLFTHCMRHRKIPLKWKESRTVLLYKKGDPEDLKNYRPICLLPVMYKLFTKVVLNRISAKLDAAQPVEQAGFRSGFSTMDHLQTINQIQERTREKGLRLYLIFIDYEKAFDSIEINAVLNALERQGVERCYIDMLEDVYDGCTTEIKLFDDGITIPVHRGVRQGDTISPKLFTAALEEIFKQLDWEARKNCGITIEGRHLTHLRFADDIVLIGTSKADVQRRLQELNRASEAVGLRINRSKTKWMEYFKTNERIHLGNEEIERVQKYVYLGQELSEDHQKGLHCELSRRIKAAWCSFNSISEVLKKLTDPIRRAQLFNSTVLPALLYGCETWTLSESLAKRLRSTQHAMKRRVLGVSISQTQSKKPQSGNYPGQDTWPEEEMTGGQFEQRKAAEKESTCRMGQTDEMGRLHRQEGRTKLDGRGARSNPVPTPVYGYAVSASIHRTCQPRQEDRLNTELQ
ncbi:reverse transcriptase, partial [Aphelenchoides avenae]